MQTIADALDEIMYAKPTDDSAEDPGQWSDSKITSTLLDRSDADLGKLLREYLTDSIHNDWDGHPEMFAVDEYYELFADMIRFGMSDGETTR
jgi:hypothetical protein